MGFDCADARWWLDVMFVALAATGGAALVLAVLLHEARERNAAQREALIDAQHRLDTAAIELNAQRREAGP